MIVGEGKHRYSLEERSEKKENIVFLGSKFGDELVTLVQGARGMIFPGEEDF